MQLSFGSIDECVKFLESIGALKKVSKEEKEEVVIETAIKKGTKIEVAKEETPELTPGDKISALWDDGETYTGVVQKNGKIKWSDDSITSATDKGIKKLSVVTNEVEEDEEKPKKVAKEKEDEATEFEVGDKVKVLWEDELWYAGEIIKGDKIKFLDGDVVEMDAEDVQDIKKLGKNEKPNKKGVIEVSEAEDEEKIDDEEEEEEKKENKKPRHNRKPNAKKKGKSKKSKRK